MDLGKIEKKRRDLIGQMKVECRRERAIVFGVFPICVSNDELLPYDVSVLDGKFYHAALARFSCLGNDITDAYGKQTAKYGSSHHFRIVSDGEDEG